LEVSATPPRRSLALLLMSRRASLTGRRATFGKLFDRWLKQIEPTRRFSTVAEYRSKIENRIRPALGSVKLSKLGADTLDAWYGKWLDDGLSPNTVHHLNAICSAALN